MNTTQGDSPFKQLKWAQAPRPIAITKDGKGQCEIFELEQDREKDMQKAKKAAIIALIFHLLLLLFRFEKNQIVEEEKKLEPVKVSLLSAPKFKPIDPAPAAMAELPSTAAGNNTDSKAAGPKGGKSKEVAKNRPALAKPSTEPAGQGSGAAAKAPDLGLGSALSSAFGSKGSSALTGPKGLTGTSAGLGGIGTGALGKIGNGVGTVAGEGGGAIGKVGRGGGGGGEGQGEGWGAGGLGGQGGRGVASVSAKTVVMGSIDPELLRKILRQYLPQFRHCYQKELSFGSENAGGVLDLNFTISAEGRVSKYAVDAAGNAFSKQGRDCVGDVLGMIDFPKPKGGGMVDVRQPLNFTSESSKI